jgi:UDP-N-acetylmuramate dehydrogenase
MHLPFPHYKEKRLCDFSTFGIGGPARYLAEAHTGEQMGEMLSFADAVSLKTLIIGKGSNCLFDDRGFAGLVIVNRVEGFKDDQQGLFCLGAGFSFARLGSITAKLGWTGLEFAAGIPATVGGAIFMNAGANGQETGNTLKEVTYVTAQGEFKRLRREELLFSYRFSSFQQWKGGIVEALFQLQPSQEAKRMQKEILRLRLEKQPYKAKSAGCVFRNCATYPAGKLIEECGLKGICVGGAAVSSLHANFIVNNGGATATSVLELIRQIKECVYTKTGIDLEEEIRYIPYES